jgi:hypothetical protein
MFLPISIKRRQTFSRNHQLVDLGIARQLGSGSRGFAPNNRTFRRRVDPFFEHVAPFVERP